MGRKKLAIKFMDHRRSRHLCFEKRKRGLLKKAMELSVVTNSRIFLTVYETDTKAITNYASHSLTDDTFLKQAESMEIFSTDEYDHFFGDEDSEVQKSKHLITKTSIQQSEQLTGRRVHQWTKGSHIPTQNKFVSMFRACSANQMASADLNEKQGAGQIHQQQQGFEQPTALEPSYKRFKTEEPNEESFGLPLSDRTQRADADKRSTKQLILPATYYDKNLDQISAKEITNVTPEPLRRTDPLLMRYQNALMALEQICRESAAMQTLVCKTSEARSEERSLQQIIKKLNYGHDQDLIHTAQLETKSDNEAGEVTNPLADTPTSDCQLKPASKPFTAPLDRDNNQQRLQHLKSILQQLVNGPNQLQTLTSNHPHQQPLRPTYIELKPLTWYTSNAASCMPIQAVIRT